MGRRTRATAVRLRRPPSLAVRRHEGGPRSEEVLESDSRRRVLRFADRLSSRRVRHDTVHVGATRKDVGPFEGIGLQAGRRCSRFVRMGKPRCIDGNAERQKRSSRASRLCRCNAHCLDQCRGRLQSIRDGQRVSLRLIDHLLDATPNGAIERAASQRTFARCFAAAHRERSARMPTVAWNSLSRHSTAGGF